MTDRVTKIDIEIVLVVNPHFNNPVKVQTNLY